MQRRGARLVASNVRSGRGEVDLVVSFGTIRVAVEVKTRIGEDPRLAMTMEKERRFVAAARALRPRPHRLDVVAVRFDRAGATIRWQRGI